jgi:hypothetical protein
MHGDPLRHPVPAHRSPTAGCRRRGCLQRHAGSRHRGGPRRRCRPRRLPCSGGGRADIASASPRLCARLGRPLTSPAPPPSRAHGGRSCVESERNTPIPQRPCLLPAGGGAEETNHAPAGPPRRGPERARPRPLGFAANPPREEAMVTPESRPTWYGDARIFWTKLWPITTTTW